MESLRAPAREQEGREIGGFAWSETGPRSSQAPELLFHLRRVIPHRRDDGQWFVEPLARAKVGSDARTFADGVADRAAIVEDARAPVGHAGDGRLVYQIKIS